MILRAICILRGVLPWDLTCPNVAAVTLFEGPPQRTLLNTLKASPRSEKRTRSVIEMFLARLTFSLRFQGVRSFGLLRVALPNSEFRRSVEMPWLKALESYQRSLKGSNLSPAMGALQFS
jgi:hypothetical protein